MRCFYSPVPESLHTYNLDFCDLIFAVMLRDPMSAKIEVKVYLIPKWGTICEKVRTIYLLLDDPELGCITIKLMFTENRLIIIR